MSGVGEYKTFRGNKPAVLCSVRSTRHHFLTMESACFMNAEIQTDLFPILEQMQRHLSKIERRVDEFVPRRHITETVKRKHIEIITLLGDRCPCCGVNQILDDGIICNAEFDHFYSRERREYEDTWLICKSCHLNMCTRSDYIDEFRCYQKKARALEGGQLTLEL